MEAYEFHFSTCSLFMACIFLIGLYCIEEEGEKASFLLLTNKIDLSSSNMMAWHVKNGYDHGN